MRDEGERRESEGDSEDPFEKYAEELGGKYEETSESGESPDAPRSVSAPNQIAETHEETEESSQDSNSNFSGKEEDGFSGETVENREDDFEAYARELKGKYNEEEEGTDSTRAQESTTENEDEATSQEGRGSQKQNGRAEDEPEDSATSDIQRPVDASEEKSAEVGSYRQIVGDRGGNVDFQSASSNSERPEVPSPDEPGLETKRKTAGDDESHVEALSTVSHADEEASKGTQRPQEKESEHNQPQNAEQKITSAPMGAVREPKTEFSQQVEGKTAEPIRDNTGLSHENSLTRTKPIENELRNVAEETREIPVVLAGSWRRKDVYASVEKTTFEEVTGVKLEKGKTYDVHFRITGVGDSWARHTESEYQERVNASAIRLHFSNAYTDRLTIGSRCNVTIDYVTDKRCLRVVATHQGQALKLYPEILGFGRFNDNRGSDLVVELGIKNLCRNEPYSDKCYTTFHCDSDKQRYNPSRLMMSRTGSKIGDIVEIQYAKVHTMKDFAENFNSHRQKNLENVLLRFENDKLSMLVDGKDVPLQNSHLSTYKLQINLTAEIRSTGKPISFRVDGENSKITILHRLPVVGVKAPDSGLSTSFSLERHRALMPRSFEHSYRDWKQVAGYFDGDGSPDFYVGKRVLHPSLNFVDNYRPHIMMLRRFLISEGLSVHKPNHDHGGAWKMGIAEAESVRKMATEMLPHLFKKRREVAAILNYFDNKITGNQLAEVFNESVREGNRTGKIRIVDIPYTRREGQELSKKELGERTREMGMRNRKLTDDELEQIRADYAAGVASNGELAKKYGVKPSTISRAVFGRTDRW